MNDTTTTTTTDTKPRGRRRLRQVLVGLLVVAVLAGATLVGTRIWRDVRRELDATAAALSDTRNRLGGTRTDLRDETANLLAAKDELAAARRLLEQRTEERDRTARRLRGVEEILAGIEGDLTTRQGQLGSSATTLDLLSRCLAGVADALNQAAVADTVGLGRTLRGIEDVCAEARSRV